MLLSIEGPEKSAKTTFAYTAPLPIVGFQFDLGHDRAIYGTQFDKYFEGLKIETHKYNRIANEGIRPSPELWAGKDITIFELPQPLQFDSSLVSGYIHLWEYFISLLGMVASDSNVNTIVLDTATVARGVKTNAYIEELNNKAKANNTALRKQLLQIEYGHVNSAFENIYTIMKSLNKTFITVHHTRDERKDQLIRGELVSVPTGNLELDGWNKTYRFVDVAIRNSVDKGVVSSEIIVCGENLELVGSKFPNMNWNFLVDLISGSLGGRKEYVKR